jgi:LemA protein
MIWIPVGLAAFLLLALIVVYNGLVWRKNRVDNAFASIDVYLKMRYDLIPNLVAAVKGYMDYEKSVLKEVTELRARAASGALAADETVELNNRIGRALGEIRVVVEKYPDLKASANVQQLMRNLTEIEDRLSASRRAYNAAVTDLNNSVEMFPSSLVARTFGFSQRRFFETPESEKANPRADVGAGGGAAP